MQRLGEQNRTHGFALRGNQPYCSRRFATHFETSNARSSSARKSVSRITACARTCTHSPWWAWAHARVLGRANAATILTIRCIPLQLLAPQWSIRLGCIRVTGIERATRTRERANHVTARPPFYGHSSLCELGALQCPAERGRFCRPLEARPL